MNHSIRIRNAVLAACLIMMGTSVAESAGWKPRLTNLSKEYDFIFPVQNKNWWILIRTVTIHDANRDGINEIYLSFTGYTDFPRLPMRVFEWRGLKPKEISANIFRLGRAATQETPRIWFRDIDGDGDKDLLHTESGLDKAPWWHPKATIGVYIYKNGRFYNLRKRLPRKSWGVRSYALAVGDLDNDGKTEILLPGGAGPRKSNTLVLEYDGKRKFKVHSNPLNKNNRWENVHKNATNLRVTDLDSDGVNDLYVGGNSVSPNHTVFWGGFDNPDERALPKGVFGEGDVSWWGKRAFVGGDVIAVATEDLNGDGKKDIFSIIEKVKVDAKGNTTYLATALHILKNKGKRRFVDVGPKGKAALLGLRYFDQLIPVDLNRDGRIDIVANHWIKAEPGSQPGRYSSTIFLNRGNFKFRKYELKNISGDVDLKKRGMIYPIKKIVGGYEVVILRSVSDGLRKNVRVSLQKAKLTFR